MSKFTQMLYAVYAIYKYSTKSSLAKIFNADTIRQLDADEFLAKIAENEDAIVMDLRTPLEYRISHHPRAINVNYLSDFRAKIKEFDTDKVVFTTCLSAHRSPYAVHLLKEQGFTQIYDLKGGFARIRRAVKENLSK